MLTEARRQVLARLGRVFSGSLNPLEVVRDHARSLKATMAERDR